MKKLFFSFVVLFGVCGYVMAGSPEASDGSALPVEYGGLKYSTSIFSVDGGTITGWSVINSVIFSSGTVTDYVSIFRTTSTTQFGWDTNEVTRIYNVANATAPTPAAFARGVSDAGKITVGPNWVWKPSVGTYNIISVLYEPK